MKNVKITINHQEVIVPENTTILEAAKQIGVNIPTLCYHPDQSIKANCRVCVVQVKGNNKLSASCSTYVWDGMEVSTTSKEVLDAQKGVLELILASHNQECLTCQRNGTCELQALAERFNITGSDLEENILYMPKDTSSPSLVRDATKCIKCSRCVEACREAQGVDILTYSYRSDKYIISTPYDLPLNTTLCTFCGQCSAVCPVGAIVEKDNTAELFEVMSDSKKHIIVQVAPAVRVALGDDFGLPEGSIVTGKLVSALKQLGFHGVFDTNFSADLTIMEEGTELLSRLVKFLHSSNAVSDEQLERTGFKPADSPPVLPMITSCSPGWIKYIEHYFPEELGHLSSCKSPHMMLGALCKSYFAEKINVDPKDMFVVSVMPCTAKKFEITRPEMVNNGVPNVDAVITTRELAKMIKDAGISFTSLPEGITDNPLGLSTGAADIFGAPGGVMEAALRTVYEIVTGRELPFDKLHVAPIQGLERIKTAEFTIQEAKKEWEFLNGITVKVATTSGLKGASILMDEISKGESQYHFIEVMGCPGGCISGGGQPRMTNDEVRKKRIQAIYAEDEGKTLRKSHENPYISSIYAEYLKKPLGHKSHELLHTTYTMRRK